jgi:N-methylhydantoinase B
MIDKVTLGVLANHCRAAAENMAYTLYRTAHSTGSRPRRGRSPGRS